MYFVKINKKAKKRLLSLPKNLRVKIAEAIYFLALNPSDKSLDVKMLVGIKAYRLRVGDWRMIFTKDDELRIIFVEKIGARGNVYK